MTAGGIRTHPLPQVVLTLIQQRSVTLRQRSLCLLAILSRGASMNKTKRTIFLLCLFQLLGSPAVFAQSDKAKKLDELIGPFAAAQQFSGVVVASEDGKVIYEKAFGVANADYK